MSQSLERYVDVVFCNIAPESVLLNCQQQCIYTDCGRRTTFLVEATKDEKHAKLSTVFGKLVRLIL